MEKTCDLPQDILDWKEFWMHAAGVGYITMDLAARLPEATATPESFYLMGLFHDIGKVVLACVMPDEFIDIYARAAAEEKPLAAMEIECLGVEHGHIGAWYMEKQGIPLVVREAVRFHHSDMLEDQPHFVHAALIRLADRLAHDIHLGNSGNQALMGDPYASVEWAWYRDYCGMARGRADKLQASVAKQVARTAASFGRSSPKGSTALFTTMNSRPPFPRPAKAAKISRQRSDKKRRLYDHQRNFLAQRPVLRTAGRASRAPACRTPATRCP